MNEKVLTHRKNGMLMLMLIIILYIASFFGLFAGFRKKHLPRPLYRMARARLDTPAWPKNPQTAGSTGTNAVWQIHRNAEGRRLLFCQSFLLRCKSGG